MIKIETFKRETCEVLGSNCGATSLRLSELLVDAVESLFPTLKLGVVFGVVFVVVEGKKNELLGSGGFEPCEGKVAEFGVFAFMEDVNGLD